MQSKRHIYISSLDESENKQVNVKVEHCYLFFRDSVDSKSL
jgi:hypothetical protein